ncbi:multicomponent Na+:H+ antiporter subunit E [Dethiosulfatibacter aminovorans DSM 17477]|uniref:Multicomponent Na+:H+ antiporter subunit E n=1 Tax=Dethiosulfatibacter aminovorans DSM 17477 TaxID=1121476 RepID=A0A1M6GSY4_9FIRM|nr:Na+/H+ antiporter subunit E [Dethiosulfatibacter aminovorans]SHJ13047.1 multicomponent Na+:H+ antiporter subunit E [Dethiosulfatibacter aminovorans DSM 17477]
MKRLMQNIQWIFIFLLVWIVLFEELSMRTAVSGLAVACLCLLFTEKYLMGDSYNRLYPISIPWLLRYIIFLLFEIYKAGIITTIKVFSGNITPGIVEIETSLESEFSRIILANSITLTPGTVTIAKEGNKLKVLWLNVETKDPEKAGMLIKKNLERVLKKG